MQNHKELFYTNLIEYYSKNKDARRPWTNEEIKTISKEILDAKLTVGSKTRRQYHLLSLYDVLQVGEKQMIIKKRLADDNNDVCITPYEDLFEILYSVHIAVGHGGRDKMNFTLKTKHYIPRPVIESFIQTCEICSKKKSCRQTNLSTKPLISKGLSSRSQVDFIDYQSMQDGEYKWLLIYQDDLTKFLCLRPLKSKTTVEVATELLKIFLEFGPPAVLQSDNGRLFLNGIITELKKLWPALKLIQGGPRHTQTQASIAKSNQDLENLLCAWMIDNNSKNWSVGCYFVQYQRNCSFCKAIGSSPFKALFGTEPKLDLASTKLSNKLTTSPQMDEEFFEELTAQTKLNNILDAQQHEASITYLIPESNVIIDLEETVFENYEMNNLATISGKEAVINKTAEADVQVTCLNCETQNNTPCSLCSVLQNSLINIRKEYNSSQKRAAEKLTTNTTKKRTNLKLGDCVLLPLEFVDRGPSNVKNIVCVITAFKNGVYQVGTSAGTIKGWYNRAEIIPAEDQFLNIDAVPEKHITVREAIASMDLFNGETYLKCSCKAAKKQCQTNRCVCFKRKIICNSQCHKRFNCLNK